MKRLFVTSSLLLLLCAAVLSADTVMVHVHGHVSPEYLEYDQVHELLGAVEDGVMDEFFSAGHIVFNTLERTLRLEFDDAVTVGAEEGVDWVLTLDIEIERRDGAFYLSSLRYRTLDISRESVYIEEDLDDDVLSRRSNESRNQAAQRIGVEIGSRIVDKL